MIPHFLSLRKIGIGHPVSAARVCHPARTARGGVLFEFALGFAFFATVMVSVADFTLEIAQAVEVESAARRIALSYADTGDPDIASSMMLEGSTSFGRLCLKDPLIRVSSSVVGATSFESFGSPAGLSAAPGEIVMVKVSCVRTRTPLTGSLMGKTMDRTATFIARVR